MKKAIALLSAFSMPTQVLIAIVAVLCNLLAPVAARLCSRSARVLAHHKCTSVLMPALGLLLPITLPAIARDLGRHHVQQS